MKYGTLAAGLSFVALLGLTCGQGSATESRLLDELLSGSNRYVRPSGNSSTPIDVTHGFSLIQLLDFDQLNQILTIVGWEYMSWTDPTLRWEASNYDDYEFVVLPAVKIWTPDIVLFNALDRPVSVHDTMAHVTSEGHVTWVTHKKYRSTCVTNPEETNPKCLLKFGSWTMNTDRINLIRARDKIDAGYYVSHHDWELVRTKAVKSTKEYPCCHGEYFSDVTYSIALELREPKPDESDQHVSGAISPRISSILCFTSALWLLLSF